MENEVDNVDYLFFWNIGIKNVKVFIDIFYGQRNGCVRIK